MAGFAVYCLLGIGNKYENFSIFVCNAGEHVYKYMNYLNHSGLMQEGFKYCGEVQLVLEMQA